MDHRGKSQSTRTCAARRVATTMLTVACLYAGDARAFELDTGSQEWRVRWDNTLQYNLGLRAQQRNSSIANNPLFAEPDAKFDQGQLVTDRLALLTEFDAAYATLAGVRVSASGWYDFAYSDRVRSQSGDALPPVTAGGVPVAPPTPYSALGSYADGKYTAETRRWYLRGAQLLDAFAWTNFNAGPVYTSLKVGRLTQLWGTALILSQQSLQYSQNATDNMKALATPGTLAKELAIPRAQVLAQFQVLPELTISGQYFGEFMPNRDPAGGTYLGLAGPLFKGPDLFLGQIPRGSDVEPKNFNDNWGVKVAWSPSWMDGSTIAGYFRHFDETEPWYLLGVGGTGAPQYHLSFAKGVSAYGASVETQLAGQSVGVEASYRKNTALTSALGPLATDLGGSEGARGDTFNVVANVLSLLTHTALWDTGQLIVEAAYTHKVKVSSNADLYTGTNNPLACPSGDKWYGCSTDDAVTAALLFAPQWLSVFPGIDLDLPLFAQYGVYGNLPTLGASVGQGSVVYTAGVHALFRRKYNLTLQYNGFYAPTRGVTDFTAQAAGKLPPGTSFAGPGPQYYAGGTGLYQLNDRGWVSLVFSMTR
jgi:hypothetical protein